MVNSGIGSHKPCFLWIRPQYSALIIRSLQSTCTIDKDLSNGPVAEFTDQWQGDKVNSGKGCRTGPTIAWRAGTTTLCRSWHFPSQDLWNRLLLCNIQVHYEIIYSPAYGLLRPLQDIVFCFFYFGSWFIWRLKLSVPFCSMRQNRAQAAWKYRKHELGSKAGTRKNTFTEAPGIHN